jgi:RNA polymerase sigma-70 factor (ECF subfamily)
LKEYEPSPLWNEIDGQNGSSSLLVSCQSPIVGGLATGKRMAPDPFEVTGLLQQWSAGDASARDRLIPLVYDRLRQLAHGRLGKAADNSLNTTALVHEAYIRLVGAPRVDLPNRAHFLALASEIMRNLLVDRARARLTEKRGAGVSPLSLDELAGFSDENLDRYTELDDAIKRLAELSPRQGRLLQYRYFGGLSLEESAAAEGVSLATAKRELRSARAWLAVDLKGDSLQ